MLLFPPLPPPPPLQNDGRNIFQNSLIAFTPSSQRKSVQTFLYLFLYKQIIESDVFSYYHNIITSHIAFIVLRSFIGKQLLVFYSFLVVICCYWQPILMQFLIWYWMYYNNIKKDRIFFFRRKSTKSTVTLLRRRAQEKDNIHSCNNSCLFSPTSMPSNVLRKNGLSFLTITLLQHFLEKQTFWFLSFYLSLIAFEKGFESIYFIS